MTWDNGKAEQAEQLATTMPSAAEIHNEQQKKQNAERDKLIDQQYRQFCISHATDACRAGGYDVKQILELTKGFYAFLTVK